MPPKKARRTEPGPLGRKIALYRKKKGLTMLQLAQAMGVTQSYISFIESGVRSPSRQLIKKLVTYFYPQGNPPLQDEWLILAGFSPESPQGATARDPHRAYEESLSADQQDLRIHFAFIRSLIRSGELERARGQIQECLKLFQGAVEVQSLVGSLELAKGNYDNAIIAQQAALAFYEQDPEAATLRIGLSDLLLSLGVSCFLKGYEQLTAYHQAGPGKQKKQLAQAAGQSFTAARDHFRRALAADPDDIYIWDEYARVCFNLAHLAESDAEDTRALWRETIRAYKCVLTHRDNRAIGSEALLEAAVFLGHAYSKSGDFSQGRDMLSLIQAVRPEYWLAHYARACQLSLEAKTKKAESLLDEALDHLAHALGLHAGVRQEAQADPDLEPLRKGKKAAFTALMQREAEA